MLSSAGTYPDISSAEAREKALRIANS
ncbi:phage integrase [Vibrio cholerae MO10]|uniref:Phage integrase n=1 Tax=Vibrio cholerae (strain MO10) TaxID=345072 RepID=A0A0X1KV06_VIBCO|nr:phage integrase [Vibrio cholerae MO10]